MGGFQFPATSRWFADSAGDSPVRAVLSLKAKYPLGGGYPDPGFLRKYVWNDLFVTFAENYESPQKLMLAIDPGFEEWVESLKPGAYAEYMERLDKTLKFRGQENGPETILTYGRTEGYVPLLESILSIENDKLGLGLGLENIALTAGSQQGLFFFSQVYLPERTIAIGEQAYLGAIPPFSHFAKSVVTVPVDNDGIDVDELERRLNDGLKIDVIYVVPFGDNPTGVRLSEARMEKLHRLAKEKGFFILMDLAYECTMEDGLTFNKAKYLLGDDYKMEHVVFLNSFSKALANLRLGYVVGKPELVKYFVKDKSEDDLHPPLITQVGIDGLIRKKTAQFGTWQNYLAEVARFYGEKRRALYDALKPLEELGITLLKPSEGFFVYGYLPEGYDAELFLKHCLPDVGFAHGAAFSLPGSDKGKRGMRFAYSAVGIDKIPSAGQELYAKAKSFLK